jgi:hypothetical protein
MNTLDTLIWSDAKSGLPITLFYTYVVQNPEWRVISNHTTGSCRYKTPKEKTLISTGTEAHTRSERHLEPFGLGRKRIFFLSQAFLLCGNVRNITITSMLWLP